MTKASKLAKAEHKPQTIELSDSERCSSFCKRPAGLTRPTFHLKPHQFLYDATKISLISWFVREWKTEFENGEIWSKEFAHWWFIVIYSKCYGLAEHFVQRMNNEIAIVDYTADIFNREMATATLGQLSLYDARLKVSAMFESQLKYHNLFKATYPRKLDMSLAIPLLFLLPFHQFLQLWQDLWLVTLDENVSRYETADIIRFIRLVVVPYINDNELAQLRKYLAIEIERVPFKVNSALSPIPLPYLMAGMFGMSDLIEPALASIPDNIYKNSIADDGECFVRPDLLLFGLNNSELLLHHFNRLKFGFVSHEQCCAWLSHFGSSNIEPIVAFAADFGTRLMKHKQFLPTASIYLDPLFRIHTIESATAVFELIPEPAFKKQCYGWLRKNFIVALPALVDIANSKKQKAIEARLLIKNILDTIDATAIPSDLLNQCRQLNAEADAARQALLHGDKSMVFAQLLKDNPVQKVSLPVWLVETQLAPITIEGRTLPADDIKTILYAIKGSTEQHIHPFLRELREFIPRFVFDNFVWSLLEQWISASGPPKEKWCLLAVAALGSDSVIAKLFPLMKEWRATGNHNRAGFALKCIATSETDGSLMLIHKISQSASLKSLKTIAHQLISEIASARNLSNSELEDRIVPSCGLDDKGNRVFDFGGRQFDFVMGSDLKPHIKDAAGKMRDDLPSPNKDDDQYKASAEIAAWKDLKKLIKGTAQTQWKRLELAMISGRRWSAQEFDLFFVHHPLMWHLAKALVWGAYDGDKLVQSFRVTDERDFADDNDKTFDLPSSYRVGVVHPLELSTSLSRWQQIWTEYELVQPFDQLTRTLFRPSVEEMAAGKIKLFDNLEFEAVYIPSTLEKRQWQRYSILGGGAYYGHFKYFPGKNLTVQITHTGLYPGISMNQEPCTITSVQFWQGDVGDLYVDGNSAASALDNFDPIVLCEAYTDLSMLAAKGKKV